MENLWSWIIRMSGVNEFNEFMRCNVPVTALEAYNKINEIISSHHIKNGNVRDYRNLIMLRNELRDSKMTNMIIVYNKGEY